MVPQQLQNRRVVDRPDLEVGRQVGGVVGLDEVAVEDARGWHSSDREGPLLVHAGNGFNYN